MDSVSLSTESKTKRSQDDDDSGEDLISEFPDDILLKILSFLPVKEIVINSTLSTRWRRLSTFFPISFDFCSCTKDCVSFHFSESDCASFLQRVETKLVVLPETARIGSFKLHWHNRSSPSTNIPAATAMSVISKAVKHKVEELCFCVDNYSREAPFQLFSLPQSLFTSQSLTCLKLYIQKVVLSNFPTSICLPSLKTLSLQRIQFQDEHSFELLLAGCPILENLAFSFGKWNNQKGTKISIPTLQKLKVWIGDNPCPGEAIISPVEFLPCDLSSVVHADVGTYCPRDYEVELAHHTLKLLKAISGVKSLILHDVTLKTISFVENFQADHLPTFYNLTHLKIFARRCSHYELALMHVLDKSPNLQSLHFYYGYDLDVSSLLKYSVPVCLQRSLKSFTTSVFTDRAEEIQFLKHVLENAQVLECFSVEYLAGNVSEDSGRKEAIKCELKQLLRPGCVYNFT